MAINLSDIKAKLPPLKELFLPTATPTRELFKGTGRLLQKFPETTIKPEVPELPSDLPEFFTPFAQAQQDKMKLGSGIVEFLSSIPGEMVRSYGKTTEKLGVGEGMNLEDILNISDFIPGIGFIGVGGVKAVGKEVIKKGGKEIGEKVLKETAEKGGKELLEEAEDPIIKKIITGLKEAKPLRELQEEIYTKARGEKLAKFTEVGKKTAGEKGFFAELGQLKGSLPKVEYESVRGIFDQREIDHLFDLVKNSEKLDPWETINAREGLMKILGAPGVTVPTEGELKLLNKVFGSELVEAVMEKRTLLQKAGTFLQEAVNFPRSIMASFDLSAPFRQGIVLGAGHPKRFFQSFTNMFKYFGDEKAYMGLMEEIADRDTFKYMKEGKLSLTDMNYLLSSREEQFMSNWAEKIPLAGRVVKASNRAYTGFLNKLRADVFDDLLKKAELTGRSLDDPKLISGIADWVNNATGRGKLPGGLESAASQLNSVFFSPRLMASRLNLLNPVTYVKQDPFVRKEALKSMFSFASAGLSVLGLAKLAGAEVGSDPRSADFGKIKIGNTRYDLWGGFQQYIRSAAQIISGKYISSTTGVEYTLGEGYKPMTRLDIASRVLESKLAPTWSYLIDSLRGTTFGGEKTTISEELKERFTPMVISDLMDVAQEKGFAKAVGLQVPGFFGLGVQTYTSEPEDIVRSANSVRAHLKQLVDERRFDEADALVERNQEILSQSKFLEAGQERISKLEKLMDKIDNNQVIPRSEKKEMKKDIKGDIKELEEMQKLIYKEMSEFPLPAVSP
ncbi:MAG: hypothetical protein [Podoviridae sp. ctg2L5]|nr:MAG: hypothetical protein [Podoviridae sp. ctg2L5]